MQLIFFRVKFDISTKTGKIQLSDNELSNNMYKLRHYVLFCIREIFIKQIVLFKFIFYEIKVSSK